MRLYSIVTPHFLPFVLLKDIDLLKGDNYEPKEETKTPLKAVVIKQEVQVSPGKKAPNVAVLSLPPFESASFSGSCPSDKSFAVLQESRVDEDLPKKLVLVEFRSLTMSAPLKIKPKQMLSNGCAKNFKCFRKVRTMRKASFRI